MDDNETWAMYFAGVAAMRCHPRNMELPDEIDFNPKYIDRIRREIIFASQVADQMLELTTRRKQWLGAQSQER